MLRGERVIIKALDAVAAELHTTVSGRVVIDLTIAGAKAGAKVIKANTPIRSAKTYSKGNSFGSSREIRKAGNLRRSIRAVKRRGSSDYSHYAVFGFQFPQGAHAHLLQSGTQERTHASGRSVGSIRATNFFTKALALAIPVINRAQVKEIRRSFKRAEKRMGRYFNQR